MLTQQLTQKRKQLGLSQQRLAELAGVSLPTVQNIESGRANPSLDILTELSRVLGFHLTLMPAPIDWDRLADLGVPLTVSKSRKKDGNPSRGALLMNLREALIASQGMVSDRRTEALAATVLALQTHWPSVYKELGLLRNEADKLIQANGLERLLKLRSLAIHNLQRYL